MKKEDPDTPAAGRSYRWVWGLFLFAGVAAAAVLVYWYGAHGKEAKEANELNAREVAPVVAALDAFRQKNGRYPGSLSQLYPEYLQRLPRLYLQSGLLFKSSESGDGCWLAVFPHYIPSFFLPSDLANEYDCGSRFWSVLDIDEARAQRDEEWSALMSKR
jgi:cyanate permease